MCVDDCFGVLYEALNYAVTWKDTPLLIGSQDIMTAFDSVEHVDMFESLSQAGATPQQVLALARDYDQLHVNLVVPGVATVERVPMTKAMRTGGK